MNETQPLPTDADLAAFTASAEWAAYETPMLVDFARAVLAKWGTLRADKIVIPTHTMEQEFQKHYQRGYEAGQKAVTQQQTQAQTGAVPLTDEQINVAARKLAECMDYPWSHMPEQGRAEMRTHAKAVIAAAIGIKGGQHGAE